MTLTTTPGRITLDLADLHLSAGMPMAVLASADGASSHELTAQGPATCRTTSRFTPGGPVTEQTWTWDIAGGHQLRWSVGILADDSGCTVDLAFRNGSGTAVRLRELVQLQSSDDGLTVQGNAADWLLTTLAHSRRIATLATELPSLNDDERKMWAGFGLPVPYDLPDHERANDGRWRNFSDFATLSGPDRALTIGAVGIPEAGVRIACRVHGNRLRLEVASEMTDVVVEPGAWRSGQEVVLLHGNHAACTERLLRWCAATHGARTHQPVAVGWCSWYHHGQGVAASDVIAIADHARTQGLPMPVIQVDDGFQRQVGDWDCNARFPDGWAPVVSAIRAADAVPGVWLAPLAVHESTPLFAQHADWLQRDASGTLSGEANNWGPRSRWLDPTHPEAASWIRTLIREHRAHGFRYFKIDFNTIAGVSTQAPLAARLHDPTRTAFQALRDLYRLYREEMGEDSYLLACIGFNRAVAGFADASRIGPDSAALWEAAHPCCIRDCIAAVGQNAQANGILFANDPDVTYTKPRSELDTASLQTWHGFVGLLGGLSLISEPLWMADRVAGATRLLLTEQGLEVELDAIEDDLRLAEPIWTGASADLYVDRNSKVGQWWLQPAVGDVPARAWRTGRDGAPQLAPEIPIRSSTTATGYRLSCTLSWNELQLTPGAEVRCEVKLSSVIGRSVPAVPRSVFTAFGSNSPWSEVREYGTITRAIPCARQIASQGWQGSERNYELLVPPVPERGHSFVPHDANHAVFGFVARREWGDTAVVQCWNPGVATLAPHLDLRIVSDGPCRVWSLWDGRDLGVHQTTCVLPELAPRAAHLVRVTPVTADLPQMVGSDLHIGCGAAEVASVATTGNAITIRLVPGAGARSGSLWLAQSAGFSLTSASGLAAEVRSEGDLLEISVRDRGTAPQVIHLERR